jgi:hypothetical protein
VVPVWELTRARGDDPVAPGDMRHYGASTVKGLVAVLMQTVCQEGTDGL